jgi:MoaA/NifB/PqqE/SkfB family radical SAM enzyme
MASLKTKMAMLSGIIQGQKAYTGPPYVVLDIIRRCNIHCLGCFFHCLQERKRMPGNPDVEEISVELVEKICKELPELGTGEIILVGEGEPFLHPRLIDFITTFKKAGLKVQVFTNGTLLHKDIVNPLIESGLDVLNVSIWAVNDSEHAACHPETSRKLLKKRIEGLKRIARCKTEKGRKLPRINLNMPLNRSNYLNIKGREELAGQVGCDSVSISYFRDWGGRFQPLTLSSNDLELISTDLREMQRCLKFKGISMNSDEYLALASLGPRAWRSVPCYAGWFQCYIKVDGTILPCGHCYYAVGNIMEQSFESIWYGPHMENFRRRGIRMFGASIPLEPCDCANCCQIRDNLKVHRTFKWIAPLIAGNPK